MIQKTHFFIKILSIVSLVLALSAHELLAQARLLGQIMDEYGKPVVAAIVSLTGNNKTGAVITNNQGYYTFLGLPEGNYNIKALKSGLSSTDKKVSLKANVTLMYNLKILSKAARKALKEKEKEQRLLALAEEKKRDAQKKSTQKKRQRKVVEPKSKKQASTVPSEKRIAKALSKPDRKKQSTSETPVLLAAAETAPEKQADSLGLGSGNIVESVENELIRTTLNEAQKTQDFADLVSEKSVAIKGGIETIYDYLEYPFSARNVSANVFVIAQVFVDNKGQLRRIDIIKKGPQVFNEEVYRVLTENIQFEPAEYNSEPIAGTMTVVVNFSPKN